MDQIISLTLMNIMAGGILLASRTRRSVSGGGPQNYTPATQEVDGNRTLVWKCGEILRDHGLVVTSIALSYRTPNNRFWRLYMPYDPLPRLIIEVVDGNRTQGSLLTKERAVEEWAAAVLGEQITVKFSFRDDDDEQEPREFACVFDILFWHDLKFSEADVAARIAEHIARTNIDKHGRENIRRWLHKPPSGLMLQRAIRLAREANEISS